MSNDCKRVCCLLSTVELCELGFVWSCVVSCSARSCVELVIVCYQAKCCVELCVELVIVCYQAKCCGELCVELVVVCSYLIGEYSALSPDGVALETWMPQIPLMVLLYEGANNNNNTTIYLCLCLLLSLSLSLALTV